MTPLVRVSGATKPRPAFRLLIPALAVAALLVAGAAARADDPDALRAEAERLAAENAALSGDAQAALLDLYALESQLRRQESEVAKLQAQARSVERRESAARRSLEVARTAEAVAQEELGEHLRTLYIQGDVDPLAVLLGASSIDDAITGLDGLNRLAQESDRIIEQVVQARASLRTALRQLHKREADLRALTAKAEAARASLAQARDEQAAYVGSLARQRELNEQEIGLLIEQAREAEALAAEIAASQPEPGRGGSSSGSAPVPTAAETDSSPEPGRQLRVSVTAYCMRGFTSTGIPVRYGVIAVDPQVIPLGTRLYVPGYGEGIAADTGSAVKGYTIDVWIESCAAAAAWGRKWVTITLLD